MFETLKDAITNIAPRTAILGGLAVAALGITVVVLLSNGAGQGASDCPVQEEARAAIDAVAQGELAALQATATGRGYSDLAFQDDTGRPMTLADFAGKPLLVNFWATWCVPCREEMPALNELAARYPSEQFAVIPIDLDLGAGGIEKAQAFLDEFELTNLPLLADPSYAAFERLKTNAVSIGLPTTLLVDSKGCELAVLQGPAAWDSPDAIAVIDKLIEVGSAT